MSRPHATIEPGRIDMSGVLRLARNLDHGRGSFSDRAQEFHSQFPVELAKVRRQMYELHHPWLDLRAVPVGGSTARGLDAGYYMTQLRDDSFGYFQRRSDDCLQAALASCLQIPPHQVPDLRLHGQLDAGKDPEVVDRASRRTMKRWMEKHGVTISYHPRPPTSRRRWIGVVSGAEDDHCLLMSRRDCLFDPTNMMPSMVVSDWTQLDIDYGITIS